MKLKIILLLCLLLYGCNRQMLCDIGEESIVGDMNITSIDNNTVFVNTWEHRLCAVEDCSAYNRFHKDNNTKCMV